MKEDMLGYCMVCHSDKLSTSAWSIEEIAAEIHVTGRSICDFKLCIPCRTKVDKCLEIIRTELVKDEWGPQFSNQTKRALRIGLKARMKVRDLRSAERKKYYFK